MNGTSVRSRRAAQVPGDAVTAAQVPGGAVTAAQVPGGAVTAAQVPGGAVTAAQVRRARLRAAVTARGIPLATILASVAVVVLTYLAGKLAYRLRDIILMILAAGFLALILNPLVGGLQRRWIRRRGQAVAVVTIWTVLVFAGLLVAFGYPLVHGLTHFSQRLPSYVQYAEHGHGWIGHLVRRFHLQAWIIRNAPKLHNLGVTLAKPALNVGKGAVSMLATLGTIFALLVLFLLEGPKMGRWLLELMPPELDIGRHCPFLAFTGYRPSRTPLSRPRTRTDRAPRIATLLVKAVSFSVLSWFRDRPDIPRLGRGFGLS
jgi:AI-2E family transporter